MNAILFAISLAFLAAVRGARIDDVFETSMHGEAQPTAAQFRAGVSEKRDQDPPLSSFVQDFEGKEYTTDLILQVGTSVVVVKGFKLADQFGIEHSIQRGTLAKVERMGSEGSSVLFRFLSLVDPVTIPKKNWGRLAVLQSADSQIDNRGCWKGEKRFQNGDKEEGVETKSKCQCDDSCFACGYTKNGIHLDEKDCIACKAPQSHVLKVVYSSDGTGKCVPVRTCAEDFGSAGKCGPGFKPRPGSEQKNNLGKDICCAYASCDRYPCPKGKVPKVRDRKYFDDRDEQVCCEEDGCENPDVVCTFQNAKDMVVRNPHAKVWVDTYQRDGYNWPAHFGQMTLRQAQGFLGTFANYEDQSEALNERERQVNRRQEEMLGYHEPHKDITGDLKHLELGMSNVENSLKSIGQARAKLDQAREVLKAWEQNLRCICMHEDLEDGGVALFGYAERRSEKNMKNCLARCKKESKKQDNFGDWYQCSCNGFNPVRRKHD